MQKKFLFLLAFIVIRLFVLPINFSNSGPIHIEGETGSEVLVFNESDIGVIHETLTIHFDDAFPEIAHIEALYNLSSASKTTQVLFPLKTTLLSLLENTVITFNKTPLAYDIVSGTLSEDHQTFDPITPTTVENVYQYTFDNPSELQFKAQASSILFDSNSVIINQNEDNIKLSNLGNTCVLYAVDAPITFLDPTPPFTVKKLTKEDFAKSLLPETEISLSVVSDILHQRWRAYSTYDTIHPLENITSALWEPRWFGFLYTLPKGQGEMSVSYTTELQRDKSNSYDFVYGLSYLLSPAKRWAFFKGLDVYVYTPSVRPYVISSNLELNKTATHYEGHFDTVPVDVWTLKLYNKPKIGFIEKHFASFLRSLPYLIFFAMPLFIIISAFVIVVLILKLIKKHVLGNK